ncbi:excalibur calcium-binding domain-containing protein [Krasilnikovia sp. MM14-A1004]|uniref:excalibur calcium-binding domain-containing protein n=1 Tax=Krasilnikovia sp. MM14-A1004 TaxID=3373541 RepID=UPI00399C7E21
MTDTLVRGIALAGLLVSGSLAVALPADAAAVPTYRNCTALNQKYQHGVGRKGAHDKVRGSSKPVTNFTVNTALYNANKKMDRDKDGVACEKR